MKSKKKNYKSLNSVPKIHHKKTQSKFNIIQDGSKILLFGTHPCLHAILNKNRKIYQIFVTKNSLDDLLQFLHSNKISHLQSIIKNVDKAYLDKITEDNNHQNIAIISSKLIIKTQIDLLQLLYSKKDLDQLPNILILDQITDPHNIGAIIRNAAAFKFNIIVFSQYNSIQESAVIAKASAGNLEFIQPYVVSNINDLILKLKKIGYWNIGLSGEATQKISDINKYKNKALILGSEGKGIRKLVKKNCDILLKIEICDDTESLNVASAAAIALFESTKS